MGMLVGSSIFVLFAVLLLSATTGTYSVIPTGTPCDTCYRHSKAAFFKTTAPLSAGACGYKSSAPTLYGGHLAAAAPSIYKGGAFCGACYEVRCMNKQLCSKKGTNVVVTDINNDKSNATDLVLSNRAFRALANPGMDRNLMNLGLVDIEYKRVPCVYKNQNLALRVESYSNPYFLALTVLFQGGQTEINGIDIAKAVEGARWISMTRDYGAVWKTNTVPNGPIQMRFRVTYGYDGKTTWARRALPANWKPGSIYNTDVQIDDLDIAACYPCDKSRVN